MSYEFESSENLIQGANVCISIFTFKLKWNNSSLRIKHKLAWH